MDYLKKEYMDYLVARGKGRCFEEVDPLKAHAFRSFVSQLESHFKPGSRILEVGFGSGYGLSLLASVGHSIVGVEVADYTFDYAKSIFAEKGLKPRLIKGNGFALPFPDETFDFVFNVGTIEHFPFEEQPVFLKEMARVSCDKVLISTPNDHDLSRYVAFKKSLAYMPEEENLQDLDALCKSVGLTPIRSGGFHAVTKKVGAISEMQEVEAKMTDGERAKFGFLKYTLAVKD